MKKHNEMRPHDIIAILIGNVREKKWQGLFLGCCLQKTDNHYLIKSTH
jgi:hypothetical protein